MTKSTWLKNKQGVEIYNPHYNDGLFVFINHQTASVKGKHEYKKLTICPFYKNEEGERVWKYRATQMGKKKRYQYDLVSIDLSKAEELRDAIGKVAGTDVPLKSKGSEERVIEKFLKL